MLRAGLKPPVPSLSAFLTHFEALFGGSGGEQLEPEAAAAILDALHLPITGREVAVAAGCMASGKTCALATYPIDILRGHEGGVLWEVIATLFNAFVDNGYPSALNNMLFMPLHKKGDETQCDNYRGIALMHPLGRLFSKVVTARLGADPHATRAASQAGFRSRYRVDDHCLVV